MSNIHDLSKWLYNHNPQLIRECYIDSMYENISDILSSGGSGANSSELNIIKCDAGNFYKIKSFDGYIYYNYAYNNATIYVEDFLLKSKKVLVPLAKIEGYLSNSSLFDYKIIAANISIARAISNYLNIYCDAIKDKDDIFYKPNAANMRKIFNNELENKDGSVSYVAKNKTKDATSKAKKSALKNKNTKTTDLVKSFIADLRVGVIVSNSTDDLFKVIDEFESKINGV